MGVSLRILLVTAVSAVSSQQPVTNPPFQGNFAGPTLYELIQRQNQLNNALLLNHALISNSMAANLHDNHLHPPTFNFPQQQNLAPLHLYPQHMQGLLPHTIQGSSAEKLAIYDALSPMSLPSPPSPPTSAEIPPPQPVVSGVVQVPVSKITGDVIYVTSDNKKIKSQDLNEENKTLLKIKAIEKSSTVAAPVTESTISPVVKTTTAEIPPSIPDVFHLLKHLNLTEEESEKLVHHVEQVVREELAKKLIETKLSAITLSAAAAPRETTEPTTVTETTTVLISSTSAEDDVESLAEEEKEIVEESTIAPASETTPIVPDRSERLLESDIPEIKLHPPKRIADKDEEYGAIKTAETHLTVMEREEEEREALERIVPSAIEITSTTTSKPTVPHEEFDPKRVPIIPRRSYIETDSDLLALATGAPLDLSEEPSAEDVAYRNRFRTTRPPIPRMVTKGTMPPRMRPPPPPTQFVQLADDYRTRLANTEDVSKLLKTFYENAYIQLFKVSNEADPRKIHKPRDVQFSEARGR